MIRNRVTLLGHVGKEPEVSMIEGMNIPVAKFSLAVTESWRNRENNQIQEHTEWVNLVAKGHIVDSLIKPYIKKGAKLLVEGKLRTRSWKTQDGQTKYITEIMIVHIELLSSSNNQQHPDKEKYHDETEDTIPF